MKLSIINSIIERIKIFYWLRHKNISLLRAVIIAKFRKIDITNPNSWEFSAFSQNGEDGIIDYLITRIKRPCHYFIEIGASNGFENNTSWLAIVRKYCGLMIEGQAELSRICKLMMKSFNANVDCQCLFVTMENANRILEFAKCKEPDVFSLDIDGNDYYIAKTIMELGFRPKIFVVEYNSTFGPEKKITIEYDKNFYYKNHIGLLYWGVSISGWKDFFDSRGYKFVTVDLSGTNAFFVDPGYFDVDFLAGIKGLEFQECLFYLNKFRMNWDKRFKLIANMKYEKI